MFSASSRFQCLALVIIQIQVDEYRVELACFLAQSRFNQRQVLIQALLNIGAAKVIQKSADSRYVNLGESGDHIKATGIRVISDLIDSTVKLVKSNLVHEGQYIFLNLDIQACEDQERLEASNTFYG